jgi:hypothetical protein
MKTTLGDLGYTVEQVRDMIPAQAHEILAKDKPETTKQAELKAWVDHIIATKVNIKLMDMILPSGKTVGDSTHEELAESGGWLIRVAAIVPPGQTTKQAGITEERLVELHGEHGFGTFEPG